MPLSARGALNVLGLAVVSTALALSLSGCTGNHKITDGEKCLECHNDDRSGAEREMGTSGSLSIEPIETGMTFAVDCADADVYLCAVRVADNEAGTVVPSRLRRLSPSDRASVTVAEPGLYAVCAGNWDAPRTVLVSAAEEGPTDVVLSL